ncbi:MAG: putative sulfate exporter family transporter [Methanobacteriota archaeon]
MAEEKINWSSLWKSEDWWAVWLGFFIMFLGIAGIVTKVPKVGKWIDIGAALSPNLLWGYALVGLGILIITTLAIRGAGKNIKEYWTGFTLVFFIAFLAMLFSHQKTIVSWGLAYALWALVLGLLISNTVGTPKWVMPAVRTEMFIKIGLVLLGARILFHQILQAGPYAMLQALLVVLVVWYACFYFAMWAGLKKSLAVILSSAVSICGVSAAIAAGGACKGDPKEISYTISLVLLMAIPMLVIMPAIAKIVGMPPAVAGAWIGGTIDTTPAVVAAGVIHSPVAMEIAAIVKMAQNLLISIAALGIALYFVLKVERKPEEERPSAYEIWFRFPKFILGFILASMLFSLVLVPGIGAKATSAIIKGVTEVARGWFFCLAFVCIGLETKVMDILKLGAGKPAIVFTVAQLFNIAFTLVLAYLIWGGILWPAPY